ncbi:MAG: hypothetical protein U5J83_16735 [Bryobacterales bacterium]|nr:hypothetical protein [Bryobacterales bacterium]
MDVWITPWEENLALPLTDWLPDLQGEPRRAIQVTMDFGQPRWFVNVIENHQVTRVAQLDWPAAVRQTHTDRTRLELRIGADGIRFGMPEYNAWSTASLAALPFTSGSLVWPPLVRRRREDGGKPNSWGWDDASSWAACFAWMRCARILSGAGRLEFAAPAPEGARLRFAAVCNVELNDGSGWVRAERQPEEFHRPEHFSSYFVPIRSGATQAEVRFLPDGWYSGFPCAIKDAMVWAMSTATNAPSNPNPPAPLPPVPPPAPKPEATLSPRGNQPADCRETRTCPDRPRTPIRQ